MIKNFLKQSKRLFACLLVLSMIAVGLPISISAQTVNSDGYIEVYTVEDLYSIRNDLTAKYILKNNIDLTEATATGGAYDFMGNGWNPIGSDDIYGSSAFSGEFDGNGNSIIGMRINVTTVPSGTSTVYLGLFANVTGVVKNLALTGDIKYNCSKTYYIGAITGYNNGSILNCANKANVEGTALTSNVNGYVGGIVGRTEESSLVQCCSNSGNIASYCYTMTGQDSYIQSDVNQAGGIVGNSVSGSTIIQCYNVGDVSVSANGYTSLKPAAQYYAYGNASGIVVGSCDVSDCYNTGNVTAKSSGIKRIYGIGGTPTRCYNIGVVSGAGNYSHAISSTEGTDCYYLAGTGVSSTGATSLSEAQLSIQRMYAGFDFDSVWVLSPNANYPYPQLRNNVQDTDSVVKTLRILSYPTKTEYYTGEQLDFTGCIVEAVYLSGKTETVTITNDMVSGYDSSVTGEQTVTLTYNGASDSFTVNVTQAPKAISMALKSEPNTKEYIVGSELDLTSATIEVAYDNGTTKILPVTLDMISGADIDHIGEYVVTVTYEGFKAFFKIKVLPVSVVSLTLTSVPDKLTYLEGQELDLTGMVVKANLNNGNQLTLNEGYSVSGYSSNPGNYTITVGYQGVSATFDVVVNAKSLVSLEIRQTPNKTQYVSGQQLNLDGLVVAGVYDNGLTIIVEDYTVSGFTGSAGVNVITVEKDGITATFNVSVVAKAVSGLTIVHLPNKLEYIEHESFNSDGLVVRASFNDDTQAIINDYELVGFSSSVGTHTISVVYKGWVDTFDITVVAKKVVDLVVVPPAKLTYFIGESFDATGMQVTALYDNQQQIIVDNYVLSGFDTLTAGTKVVYVTFGGMQKTFSVTVTELSEIKTEGSITVGNGKGNPGDKVTVPVTVNKNTGVAGVRHTISFDATKLKFVSANAVGQFANGQIVVNTDNAKNGEVVIVWFNAVDVTVSDVMYNVVFEILSVTSNLTTKVNIAFTNNDNGNASGENVLFTPVGGEVEIVAYWLGDLDGDRVCEMEDLLFLAQYVSGQNISLTELQKSAADVNENGTIDIHDVILLSQWLLNAEM